MCMLPQQSNKVISKYRKNDVNIKKLKFFFQLQSGNLVINYRRIQ